MGQQIKMAKLDITLTKEKFDSLDDTLKTFYVATQDGGYELEGIGSIQRALAEEKAKKATKPELITELEELKKFKADHEAAATEAANKDLEAKGKYEEALAAKEKAWQDRIDAVSGEKDGLFADVKRERLTNELVKRGVLPDRAAYLVGELDPIVELTKGDAGYELKKKGGIGDATEFDSLINAAKEKTPFFFAAEGASGSGASGSGNGNGGGKSITRAMYDANPAAYGSSLAKGEITITD